MDDVDEHRGRTVHRQPSHLLGVEMGFVPNNAVLVF
jgi:hypothetical protein